MLSEAKHLSVKNGIDPGRHSIGKRFALGPPLYDSSSGLPAYNCRMDRSKLVVVQPFATQVEADLAKSMLESAGIDSMIQSDRAGGMRDHLAWSGFGFKVLVREEDAAEAHKVLEPPPEGELVFIQTFRTLPEADSASSALLSAGVVATIVEDAAVGVPLSFTSSDFGIRLLVRKEDADKARHVLKQLSGGLAQQNG